MTVSVIQNEAYAENPFLIVIRRIRWMRTPCHTASSLAVMLALQTTAIDKRLCRWTSDVPWI